MTALRRISSAGLLALGLAVLFPGLPGLAQAQQAPAAEQSDLPLVTLATATRAEIVARVPVSGSLVARQEVQVHANVSGHEITAIRAEVGDRVKAGDVLALLDDEALSASLAQAEAEHGRAEASLTQAGLVLERTRSLRQSGNASQAVLDEAVAGEAAARAAVAQADAARRIARLNLSHARIVAPVDGVVVARGARLGAIAGAGAEPLFTLIAGGEIELEADVIETALAGLAPGDAAEVTVAGVGAVAGQLRLAPASVDPVTRLGQARVTLEPDPRLRVGLFASGWIVTDRREALTVPVTAVLADDSGERVQVIANNRVETRKVRAGIIWQGRREIIEGLHPGEQVLARAGAFFRDGDEVQAVAPPPAGQP